MNWDDRATDLDTYNDGQESPREPDDRDDAFLAIISSVERLTVKTYPSPISYASLMEVIDRLIDVADHNIDVTNASEYTEHAQLPANTT